MRWRKAAILGVGLLGGSLGLALRRRRLAAEVVGYVRREGAVEEAVRAGAVDRAGNRVEEVVEGADLVVFCTPVAQMGALAEAMSGRLQPGVLVTDVGSVKRSVIVAVEDPVRRAGGRFVGSHPMAGSERTGVGAARADLFEGAVSVVTPTAGSEALAVGEVRGLWEAVGARVLTMAAEQHDELVSRSSHLPHLVAAGLAQFVLAPEAGPEQRALCATGFRDTTRVALGSPEMWRDIAMANREAILGALEGFGRVLEELRVALEQGDAAAVEKFLRVARERRDGWSGMTVGNSRGVGE